MPLCWCCVMLLCQFACLVRNRPVVEDVAVCVEDQSEVERREPEENVGDRSGKCSTCDNAFVSGGATIVKPIRM